MIPCEEEIQIRDMARQFAQERLKPFAADWDREHRFPAEAIREMADLGFLGMLVPAEWGAAQTGHLAYAMSLEEIAAGDGSFPTSMSVHNSFVVIPLHTFG
ncbi:acyl-CoA dehydrogenase family protein, partial [Pseudomonas aeruginosa]